MKGLNAEPGCRCAWVTGLNLLRSKLHPPTHDRIAPFCGRSETNAAVNNPQVKDALDKFGFELQGSSSDELGKFIREQLAAWRQAVKEAGIEPD